MSNRESVLLPLCPAYTKFLDSVILMYSEIEDPTLLVNDCVPLAGWYRRNMLGEFRKRGSQRLYKYVAKVAAGSELVYEEFQTLLIDLHQAWGCEFIDGCDFQRWDHCLEECEAYLRILRPGLWATVQSSGLLESVQAYFARLSYSHSTIPASHEGVCLGQQTGKCGCGAKYSALHHAHETRPYNRYRSLEEFKKDAKYTTQSDDDSIRESDSVHIKACVSEPAALEKEEPPVAATREKLSTTCQPQGESAGGRSGLLEPESVPHETRIDEGLSPPGSSIARSVCDEEINRIKHRFGIPVRDERIDLMD